MIFKDEDKAQETIKYISYYKIKEFAEPFATETESKNGPMLLDYNGVFFEKIISRYYQDKNFRLYILHAIEDIEVALQTQIAYVLGESVGDYGYLDFKNWTDISRNKKEYIIEQENILKEHLKEQIRLTNKRELSEKIKYGKNNNFPPVWLAMNELMFGQLIQLLNVMSKRNLSKISNYFNCTNEELISWMKCLNLVRNISAHNSNLIDIQLRTIPKTRKEWNKYLYKFDNHVYTNRVSIPIVILQYLMRQINPRYKFGNISTALQNLTQNDEDTAHYLGFNSSKSIELLFPVHKNRTKKRNTKRNKKSSRQKNKQLK